MSKNKAHGIHTKHKKKEAFDKYFYYHASVQSSDTDVEFFEATYKQLKKKRATVFCEDFCGTFANSCSWVKRHKDNKAIGVDLDPEPIEYGKQHYLSELNKDQQKRVTIYNDNVLNPELPKADIIAGLNFSYFIFKTRQQLKDYLKSCHHRLKKDGVLFLDCFGGSQCQEPNEEETEHDKFSYFWDQDSFDPVNNHAMFYIHFKVKGEKKRQKVFTYDWRMWSIPEIRDLLEEVGFKKVQVYWEGTDKDGEGDGEFKPVSVGEECEAWVAYIIAEK
ncbi:MAG: class I SAM-dependent methyltransferase [Pseudobdellovibrionaceae bacterium]|nr:class I SAM-dependent methyltransferase [Bdellovibrionales bacterium]USN48978.1 MAG: class I SAM-dependent methyltransferase [Pseudobdellovibrionaceae bacterium]